MEKNKTLLDSAKTDLKVSKMVLSEQGDDLLINAAAYHLQQALEKSLKFRINMLGEKYPMTHNIELLIEILRTLGDALPEWLVSEASLITEYEQKTRYVMGYVTSKKKIQSLLILIEEIINKFEPETDDNKTEDEE